MRTRDIVVLGVLAVGAYWLYQKFKTGVNQATDAIAKPIADTYVALTSPDAPVPHGAVLMPDGSTFPAANLSNYGFGFHNGIASFSMNGASYALSPHDANGNYPATRI